jgi:ubiquitin-conjugating enzyme E2 variant
MITLLQIVLALLLVDFISGLVHWAEDTFGTEDTPIVGPWIVAPNVLHHHDASAFVSKGWLAGSWDLALVGVIVVAVATVTGHLGAAVVLFAIAGANANQIHKWNHLPNQAPWFVRALWRVGLMQRPSHHARHHRGQKNSSYCVVTPFVNPVLDGLGFWRRLERIVVPITGAPRREDLRAIRRLSWFR